MNFSAILLVFCIGLVAGLRSMTAPAVVSWAAHWGWLNLQGSRLAQMGTLEAAIILTILAVAELVADKMPFTPDRTKPAPLVGRVITGSLCGAALAVAGHLGVGLGVALGAAGAVTGAFGGFYARRQFVKRAQLPDVLVALGEDAVAIGGAFAIVLLASRI